MNQNDSNINPRNRRSNNYQCLNIFWDCDTSLDQLIEKSDNYEIQNSKDRQLFIHGGLIRVNLRREKLYCGAKKVVLNALTDVHNLESEIVYAYNNILTCLFCIWTETLKKLKKDTILPEPISTENYEDDSMDRSSSCTQRTIDYSYDIFKEEGEIYVTQ